MLEEAPEEEEPLTDLDLSDLEVEKPEPRPSKLAKLLSKNNLNKLKE